MTTFEIEAIDIRKTFGPLVANDGVTLKVASGEVHALMGENGAGKSTLMSVLYGIHQPDSGLIRLRGQVTKLRSPSSAIANGIGMVHQNFKLLEPLTVWENIVFGSEPNRLGIIDTREAVKKVAALAERYGLHVDPRARVDQLSVGVRQRVEILKALYKGAQTLILDEPTAVLGPQERDSLFGVVRDLRSDGRTIILVTHKINEVLDISQNITVMRNGKVTGKMTTSEATADEIVSAMTGRSIHTVRRTQPKLGDVVLKVRNVTVAAPDSKPVVDGVTFEIRAGEIVGIAGVAGNGQTELIEAITGLRRDVSGSVELAGADISRKSVLGRREAGLAYIPEDRTATGTAPTASAKDNLLMGFQRQKRFCWNGIIAHKAVVDHAKALIARFGVKIASEKTTVGTLSGGNLQKIVVAREVAKEGVLLVAEQPTRGVDVGAIEYIHSQLLEESAKGRAILLVSSELSELFALSDRIMVMYEGRAVAQIDRHEATEAILGSLMAGKIAA